MEKMVGVGVLPISSALLERSISIVVVTGDLVGIVDNLIRDDGDDDGGIVTFVFQIVSSSILFLSVEFSVIRYETADGTELVIFIEG